jgi:uncharacterized protein involved in exopolysaccharide biosynthesis
MVQAGRGVRGWVVFAVTAAVVLAGAVWWVAGRPAEYTSSAVVALTPKATKPVSAGVVTLAAPRYVAYSTSPYVLRIVAAPLGLDSVQLQNGIIVTMAAATANISVAVTLDDPELAAKAANAVAAEVIKRTETDPILDAQMLSGAVPATAESGPDPTLVLAVAAGAALLLGGLAWVGVERYRRRRAAVVRGVAPVPAVADLTVQLPICPVAE